MDDFRQHCLLSTAEELHVVTHGSYDSTLKTCTGSSQTIPAQRGEGDTCVHTRTWMCVAGHAYLSERVWRQTELSIYWLNCPPALVTYLHLLAEELLTTSICGGKVGFFFKGVAPGRLIQFFTPHGWYSEQHTGQTVSHLGVIRAAFYLTDTTPGVGYSSGLQHKLSMQKALAKKYIQ